MATLFYDHLVPWDTFRTALTKYKIVGKVAEDLDAEVDELLHHKVLHEALDMLPERSREVFFAAVLKNPGSPAHMQTLLRADSFAQEKIRVVAEALIAEVIAAIDRSHMVK